MMPQYGDDYWLQPAVLLHVCNDVTAQIPVGNSHEMFCNQLQEDRRGKTPALRDGWLRSPLIIIIIIIKALFMECHPKHVLSWRRDIEVAVVHIIIKGVYQKDSVKVVGWRELTHGSEAPIGFYTASQKHFNSFWSTLTTCFWATAAIKTPGTPRAPASSGKPSSCSTEEDSAAEQLFSIS